MKKSYLNSEFKRQITKGKIIYSLYSKDSQIVFLKALFCWHFFSIPTNMASFQIFTFSLIPLDPNFTSLFIATAESSLRKKYPTTITLFSTLKSGINVASKSGFSDPLQGSFFFTETSFQLYWTSNVPGCMAPFHDTMFYSTLS